MKKGWMILIAGLYLLAACRGVEMLPPPQPSQVPSQTSAPIQQATHTLTPLPPANQPVVGTPAPHNRPTQPFDPKPADAGLTRGNVFIDSAQVLTLESSPPQFTLLLSGNLPTPCNQLRVEVMEPDQNAVIQVDAYSVVNPKTICAQVLSPFKANIPLGTFPKGKYIVSVNGQEAGQITVP